MHRILTLALTLLLVAGCAVSDGTAADVDVTLSVSPDPPRVGPATITVALTDGSGTAVSGAVIDLEGTMTHAGMVPVFDQAEETQPGRYEAQLEFTMGGDWVIIVRAALPDGSSLEQQFDVPGVRSE